MSFVPTVVEVGAVSVEDDTSAKGGVKVSVDFSVRDVPRKVGVEPAVEDLTFTMDAATLEGVLTGMHRVREHLDAA